MILHPGLEVVAEQLLELEQPGRAQPAARIGGRGRDVGFGAGVSSRSRIASSTSRTERSSATTRRASCSWNARSGVPSSARAWPMRMRAVLQAALDRRRELEQPQRVGDRRAALADPGRDLVVREREVLDQLLVRGRFLERVQLLALDVLDDGVLEHRGVVGDAHDRRDGLQPDPPRRAPAALARDQLVAAALGRAHENRLQDADLADRVGQRGQRLLVEVLARLLRVRPDLRGRDIGQPAGLFRDRAASGSARRAPYPALRVAPRLTSLASSRYASAPREVESNTVTGCPNDGASEMRTVRGTTVRYTLEPKCARTSRSTCSASFVRASYIVSTMPRTSSAGIEVRLHQRDVAQQLPETLERVVLALDRDDHVVRGGQAVDGQQPERRRAVDQREVVVEPRDLRQRPAQLQLPGERGDELDLGAGEIDGGRDDEEVAGRSSARCSRRSGRRS